MSIPNDQVPKTMHVVSGADVTQFSYDFYAPDTANIYVLVDGVAVSSGWTVSSASTSEGMVEFDSPVVMGATVTVYRSTPMTQPVDLEQGDTFYPQVITEALDNVVMGMQELRGGTVNIPGEGAASAAYAQRAGSAASAGYAATAGYAYSAGIAYDLDSSVVATSAGHATTAAGLDSGVIVSSAAHATNADSATIANGTEYANSAGYAFSAGVAVASGGTANYASSAGYATNAGNAGYATNAGFATNAGHADDADIASSLTSGAKDDILSSAGGKYTGPFAIEPDEDNEGKYKIRGGVVYAGGSRYNINEADNLTPPSNDYLYLVMSSGGGSVTSSYQNTYPSSTNPDMLVTRIGNIQGGTVTQMQFGDITCVPWGATGGGAVSAYAVQISSGYSASTPGIVFANTSMSNSDQAGNEARITTDDNPWITYAKVPQGGPSGGWAPDGDADRGIFNSGIYGCSYTMSVASGAIVKLSGSLPQTVYFLGFGNNPNN